MSDRATFLAGDFTWYFGNENNRNQIKWTGVSTGTETAVRFYSGLVDLAADQGGGQMDDRIPIRFDTPEIFRMLNAAYIDDETVEHITAGSIHSDDWTNNIRLIGIAPTTNFDQFDIGRTIVAATTGDTGTLLDFNHTRQIAVIRPTDATPTTGDIFDNATEAYTIQNENAVQVEQVEVAPLTFIDQTAGFNDATDANFTPFPATEEINDYVAFGFSQEFSLLTFDNASAGAVRGVGGVVIWEYWNGAAWTALTGVTDGTSSFTAVKADGQKVTFTTPTDWAELVLDSGSSLFYARARITTIFATNPVYDQGFVGGVGAGTFAAHDRHGEGSVTGEHAWSGINTQILGSLPVPPHFAIFRESIDSGQGTWDEKLVISTKAATDWYGDGDLSILLKVKEAGSIIGKSPSDPTKATANFLLRQPNKEYGNSLQITLPTAGGAASVPVPVKNDNDDDVGNRQMILTDAGGTFIVGEKITDSSDATIAGVVTSVSGANPNVIIQYYLVGDPLTDFTGATGAFTSSGSGTGTAVAPSDVGPALDSHAVTLGATTLDINNGGGAKPYSTIIDPASLALKRMFQRMKFINRRSSTTAFTIGLKTFDGEEWIGSEMQVQYTGQAGGNFVQGSRVFDQTTGGEGTVLADHDDGATGDLILTNVRGVFTAANVVSMTPSPTVVLSAAIRDDGGTFTNLTTNTKSVAVADVNPFSTGASAANDAFYIGALKQFGTVEVIASTAGTVGVSLWEYWNGTAWSSLEAVSQFADATTDLKTIGTNSVVFAPPGNWQKRTVGNLGPSGVDPTNLSLYYIRIRVTAGYTIEPIISQVNLKDFVTATLGTVRTISPVGSSPLGTFASPKFFGAPGVGLTIANLISADVQNYQIIDDDGNLQKPPNTVSPEITNLVSGDSISMKRISVAGGTITRNQFAIAAGAGKGDATLDLGTTIPSDNPTLANSKVRITSDGGTEHRYRYDSYAAQVLTLSPATVLSATAGSNNTSITRAAGSFVTDEVEVGDLVRNTTDNLSFSEVETVSALTLTVTDNGVTWSSKGISINTLVENYSAGNEAYIPVIERVADTGIESNQIVQSAPINVRVDVRRAIVGTAISAFTQDGVIGPTGLSTQTVRNSDGVFVGV